MSLHTIQNYHFVIFVYIINTNQALVVQIIPSTHNINKESPKKGEKKSDDDVVNNVKKTKKNKKKVSFHIIQKKFFVIIVFTKHNS